MRDSITVYEGLRLYSAFDEAASATNWMSNDTVQISLHSRACTSRISITVAVSANERLITTLVVHIKHSVACVSVCMSGHER